MKKRILAVTFPLILGGVSYASSIELFEKDYTTITETVLDASGLAIFKDRELIIEGVTRTDNMADFEANSQINFNEKENLQIKEIGEVVFTNYADNKGVATIISNSDYVLHSQVEGADSILMTAKGVATQSQIDRENQHFKFSSQFPVLEITNPDTTKPGRIRIEGLVGEGNYGFKDNFEKIDALKGTYKTGNILVEVNDQNSDVKINIHDLLLDTALDYSTNIQKSIFELNEIEILSADSGDSAATKINLGKLAYHTGAEIRGNAPTIFADVAVNDIQIVPKNREVVTKFGDLSFDLLLTPLAADLFEKLAEAGINDFSNFDASYKDAFALFKDYVVDNTAMEFHIDGKIEGHEAKKFLSITPKAILIEKLASVDITDDAAIDQLFAGLSFFEFVNKYIAAIELDITSSKAYVIEFGSNLLLAAGEEETMDAARASMQEMYQQMQLMAMMLSAEAPLVEFVGDGLRVHIQYKDQAWIVNGKPLDLEALAGLLN